jgi:hypothetical protein
MVGAPLMIVKDRDGMFKPPMVVRASERNFRLHFL